MQFIYPFIATIIVCLATLEGQTKNAFSIINDIAYLPVTKSNQSAQHLDIYAPHKRGAEVFIFIHGGSWSSGDKSTYAFIGKRMAQKGKVCVIINYRLSPGVNYRDMAVDCARATQWVKDSIVNYGGNPDKITIAGHSAGAHLAAYLMFNNVFEDSLKKFNPVKGCVLIDAFGLDIYSYLMKYKREYDKHFYETFTNEPDEWRRGSPLYALRKTPISFAVFTGGWTYPSIKKDSEAFSNGLQLLGCKVTYDIIGIKRHIGMILQLYWPWNNLYKRIIPLMEQVE